MITRTKWSIGVSIMIMLVTASLVLPALTGGSNCGGNSAALAACKSYLVVLKLWEGNHDGQSFDYTQADAEVHGQLRHLSGASWIRSARLLAKLEHVNLDLNGERYVVLVCDRAYNNVPRRLFGRAPMAHAVAYSTGETGLISPDEFSRLDTTGFVDLQGLHEDKVEQVEEPSDVPPADSVLP